MNSEAQSHIRRHSAVRLICKSITLAFAITLTLASPATAQAQTCALYPIALPESALSNAVPGVTVLDIFNGKGPGQFGWLSWGCSPSEPALVASLTPPGNSESYVNPDNPDDHQISVGDWVSSKPGVSNSRKVRDALDGLKAIDIVVPVWDQTRGSGDKAAYRVSGFARVRILSYHLPQQNRISARFLGPVACDRENLAPSVSAGPDQTITLPADAVLSGAAWDDGLPAGSALSVSWSQVSGPGTAVFANGCVTNTTASFSVEGTYVLRLTASDSQLSSSDDVVVTVNRQNQAPVADAQNIGNDEDTALPITLTGSDSDDDAITYIIVTQPSFGTLSGTAPNVVYTPAADYHGPDEFTFRVNDGLLDSAAANVSITNRPVNDAPVADAQSLTTNEDVPLAIALSGSDIEGGALTYSIIAGPTNGTLSGSAPNVTYIPNANFHGNDAIVFQVNDGELTSASAVISLTVISENDAPAVAAGADQFVSLPQNSVVLTGTVDDDYFFTTNSLFTEWSLVTGPGTASFSDAFSLSNLVTFSASGVYQLRLYASDGLLDDFDDLLVIVNAGPVVSAGTNTTVTYPSSVLLAGAASDDGLPTNGVLTVVWSKSSGPGTVHFADAQSTNTSASFSEGGAYVLRLTASDSVVETAAEITVIVNKAPIVDAGADQTNSVLTAQLLGTVSDDGIGEVSAQWSKVSGPGSVAFSTNAPVAEAVFSEPGIYTLRLTASDGLAEVSDEVVILVNSGPSVFAGADLIVNFPEDAVLAGVVSDDGLPPGGLEVEWTQVSGPGTAVFADSQSTNTTASFTVPGTYVLQLTANDSLLTASDEITVIVNDPPRVNAGPDQVVTGLEAILQGNVTDDGLPPGSVLAAGWTKVSGPGSVSFSTAGAATTALFSQSGQYVLRLTADDSYAQGSDNVAIRVNTAPVAADQSLSLNEDSSIAVVLQAMDADGNPLTFTVTGQPGHGTLTGTAPNLTYTPVADYFGSDSFTFTASDDVSTSMPATVSLSVAPVNDAPSFAAGADQTVSEDSGARTIDNWASDISAGPNNEASQAITFLIASDNPALFSVAPTVASNGTLTFTPATDGSGTAVVTIRAQDNGGNANGGVDTSAPQTFTITITAANDAPVAFSQSLTNTENQTLPITLTATDVDGDPLTFQITASPINGVLSGTAPNVVYTPNAGYFGLDSFRFTVSDGAAQSAEATVSIYLGPLPRSRTYTLDADFAEGQFFKSLAAEDDELKLRSKVEAFNNLWVAVSSKGTIVRINTDTGEILGEYRSAPQGQPLNPSRTTVDLNGSVWAANRSGNSVVHVAVAESGLWVDRNNNGVLDTSTGLGDVRPWPNTGGIDTDGGADTAEDELILHYVKVRSSGTRHVSVNSSNNVWVTGTGTRQWDLIDGDDGTIIRQEPSVGYGGYGGLIDRNGVIWSARPLFRWDTSKPLTGPNGVNWKGYSEDSYGIGLDSLGNVWVAQLGSGKILKIAADGTILGRFNQGAPYAQGVAVGLDDHVWVAHSIIGGSTVGHLKNDGTWIGNVKVGSGPTGVAVDVKGRIWVTCIGGTVMRINPDLGPLGADGVTPIGEVDYVSPYLGGSLYNYSDMTGSTLTGFPGQATWTITYDGQIPQARWGAVTWNSKVFDNGQLVVTFSTSEDGIHFGPKEALAQPNTVPTSVGRYAKVEVLFLRSTTGKGPILYDLTLGTEGYNAVPVQPLVNVDAGQDRDLQLPLAAVLQASVWHNGFYTYNTNQSFVWSKVSGPGSVTFETPNAALTSARFSEQGDYVVRAETTLLGNVYSDDVQIHAIPINRSPWVNIGADRVLRFTNDVLHIDAFARDDGLPAGSSLSVHWRKIIGPGSVTFSPTNNVSTDIEFTAPGIYVLELTATDGDLSYSDRVEVRVQALCEVMAPSGIVQWWPGNAETLEWVRGNELHLMNGATFTNAQISHGFYFNGTTNHAKAFEHESLDIAAGAGFTMEFWIKPATTGRLFEWDRNGTRGVYVDYNSSGDSLTFHLVDTNNVDHSWSISSALSKTAFRHIGFTYDRASGVASLFINGILHSQNSLGSFRPQTGGDFYIAGVATATPRFGGIVDEMSLYNRPLNGQEIFDIYSSQLVGKCPRDNNLPPVVDAGSLVVVPAAGGAAALNGSVTDDGLPEGISLYSLWRKVSGPGSVSFDDPNNPATTATFGASGIYVLELYADDAIKAVRDQTSARVNALCTIKNIPDLTGWWPGENSSADVFGGSSALRINGASFANGYVGSSFFCDGANDYFTISARTNYDVGSSASGFTVEFWMHPNSFQDGSVLGWANGVRVERYGNGWTGAGLRCHLTGTAAGQYVQTPNHVWSSSGWNWTHVAVTYDRALGQGKLYVNGVLLHTVNVGGNLLSTAGDFHMGQVPGSANHFSGRLDEVSIYRRPLNPEEVYNIFASDIAGKCPNDSNTPPLVNAGPDLFVTGLPGAATLNGAVNDDGLPEGSTLRIQWSKLSGPGGVSFGSSTSAVTTVTFDSGGLYTLQLAANDGEIQRTDLVQVRVESPCSVDGLPGLAAWWPGNGTSADVVNGSAALLGSGASYSAGKVDSAFQFDGANDYVWALSASNYNVGASEEGFTVEFWMNPNSFQDGSVLGWANGVRVERYGTSWTGAGLRCYLTGTAGGQYVQTPSYVWSGGGWSWTHVAVTYDRALGQGKLYVNGVLLHTATVGTNLLSTAGDFYFGQVPGSGNYFSGQLDEVTLYSAPLTPEDIYSVFAAGSTGKCPNDNNTVPFVYAGPDLFITGVPGTAVLEGESYDDGLPPGSSLRFQWNKFSGPGSVNFVDPTSLITTATFSSNGIYVLQLTVDDGQSRRSDFVEVRVEALCTVNDPQGLAAWWPGNGASEDVFNGGSAILGSGTGYTAGRVASAFHFDGANDYVWALSDPIYDVGSSTSGFTVEFWMNPNSFQDGSILGWGNGVRVERYGTGWTGAGLRCYLTGTAGGQYVQTPSYVWSSGGWNWTHVAVSYDRTIGQGKLYVNGVLLHTATVGTNLLSTAGDFYFGQVPGSAGYFSGQLDEISLYARPLNPEEINNVFVSGSVGKCPPGDNAPPFVDAGPNLFVTGSASVALTQAQVSDDGLPPQSNLRLAWSKFSGPGTVAFGAATSLVTTATFSANGIYVLQLTADDGEIQRSDLVEVRVESLCSFEDRSDLVAWWPGNGTSANVMNGVAALLGSGAGYTPGKVASAFHFDGANDYVWALSASNYNVGASEEGFTVEFWMNPNSFQDGSVLGWANGVRVERYGTSWTGAGLRCYLTGTAGGQYVQTPSYVWSSGGWNWTHVAVTYDRALGQGKLYVNGVLLHTATVGTNLLSTAGDFYFGQVPGSASYFSGQLDEISLYTRVLSPEEVSNVYASGAVGKCPPDENAAPIVSAGNNISVPTHADTATLRGTVTDDGLPLGSALRVNWSQFTGPGVVAFANSNEVETAAAFSTNGLYVLQLTADDGSIRSSDLVEVRVGIPCSVLDPAGLAAWWPGNGTSMDVIGGNSAILGSGAGYTAGKVASAFQFDGANDYVWTLSQSNYNVGTSEDGFTVEFWMHPNSFQDGSVLGWANGVRVERYGTSWAGAGLRCYVTGTAGGQYVQTPSYVWSGSGWNWTHVAVSYDRTIGQGKLYVNGVLLHTATVGTNLLSTAGDFYMGQVPGSAGYFSGQLDEISAYTRPLPQSEVQAVFNAGASGKCISPRNQSPIVFAGADKTIHPPTNTVTLNGTVLDDNLPSNTLAVAWTYLSGPSTVLFTSTNTPVTTVTFADVGTYVFRLSASDGEYSSEDTTTITVLPDPRIAPTVAITSPADGAAIRVRPAGTNLTVTASAADADDIVAQVEFFVGDTSFAIRTNAPYAAVAAGLTAGIHTFTAVATDRSGLSTTSAPVAVTLFVATNAPLVSITSPAISTAIEVATNSATTNITIVASASDQDGMVARVDLWEGNVVLASFTNAPYSLGISNLGVGTYTFTAVATDDDGNTTTSSPVVVTVYVDQGGPVVELFSPEDGSSVTAPVAIIGTASSPILQSYSVQYRFKTAEDSTPLPWVTLNSGSISVISNTVAMFDPTLLLNGIYEVQLVAADAKGRTAVSDIQTLLVSENLKVGHFAISFTDLSVPVAGVPIEIIRTYDSRDRNTNDFGVGWSLDIRNVRLQKTRNLGANWQSSFTSPWYSLDSIKPRRISIKLAGDETFEFESVLTPSEQFGFPIESTRMTFTNLPGTYGKLEIDGENQAHLDGFVGFVNLINIEDFSYFNPTRFKFTSAEGDVYIIDEKEGLKSLTDRNNNTLTITTNGVFHSSGVSVTFTRDAQGRISRITDPLGNALAYAYGTNGALSAFTDRVTTTTTFSYTNTAFPHYLTDITDPRGVKAIRTEFDANGRIARQIDGDGNVIEFTHDLSNNREIFRDRLGNVTIHEYDERGNVVRTTDALGNLTTFRFDAVDNLLEQVDALGNTNRFTYDGRGNKLSETDPLGYTTHYTYGQFRELTSIRNARGFTTTNFYDSTTGDLIKERDPLGNETTYTYDPRGNLLTRTDALGNVTSNRYSSLGYLTNTVVIDSIRGILSSTSFRYDTNGNQLSKSIQRTTPGGLETLTTTFRYDAENRLVETVHPDGSTNSIQYALGLDKPAVEIDGMGRQTFRYYDSRGNLTNTVHPDLTSESFHFDLENREVEMLDRAGRLTAYGYDALGRMTNTVFADGSTTNTVYDAIGRIVATRDERGNVTRFAYDPNCGCSGRQAFITNALGQVTQRSYDENANEAQMIDALGRTTTFLYDPLDRKAHTVFADGSWTLTTYDAVGRRIAETDQNTNTTWFAYDALSRLVAVTNALGKVTSYAYDEAGNLVVQTDANGHTTMYEYDSMGRRVKRTLPLGQVETYAYDRAGNMTNKVDFNGRTTGYSYDPMNRLLSKVPDPVFAAPPVIFTYTGTGQRATMSDASGATTYTYDLRDRLQVKAMPQGTLVYSNDAAGNVTFIGSLNANGASMAYTYDALNRLETVTDGHGTTTYGYDAVGNLAGYVYPNGVASIYTYDSLNRLTNLVSSHGLNLRASYRYTVAPSGHRLTAAENVVTTNGVQTINRLYSYDATYRLINENYSVSGPVSLPASANVGYTLDDVGNRLTRTSTLPGVEGQNLAYDANDRLTTDTYDNNGNTVAGHIVQSEPTVTDVYDFEDRLINRNNGQVTVIYDGDGNRVAKTVGGVTTLYLVDDRNPTGYAQVLEELQTENLNLETPAVRRVYTYGHDLISQDQLLDDGSGGLAWAVSFHGYDGHGNVRYLTDTAGDVTDTYDYDAFGNLIAHSSIFQLPTPNTYLYCGEQFDVDLELYYNRARYLNADSGRFWTRDVFEGILGSPISLHKYLYANADPINRLDPSGLYTLGELMTAIGVNNFADAAKAIGANKARKKSVKTLGCVAGIESLKKYMAYEFSEKHHPIPTSMGGPNVNLLPLPSESHRLFHFVLHILLKDKGGLHNYSSAAAWAKALETKAGKIALLKVIKTAGAYVDKQCDYPKSMGLVRYIEKNEKEWLK